MGISEEIDKLHDEQAERERRRGAVQVRMREGEPRPFVHIRYGDPENWEPDSMYGGWFGPFKDRDEAQEFIEAGSFVASYRSGHGVWKVGHRLRYVGMSMVRQAFVEECPIGTTAVITNDNGYSYRYTLEFEDGETPTRISSLHPDGEHRRTKIRTSGFGWERIFDDNDKEN